MAMTGRSASSWSWLDNVAVPALLGSVEAGWVSAWISALAHGPHHDLEDLPALAPMLVIIVAVTSTAWLQHAVISTATGNVARSVVPVVVPVVGVLISAGVLASLYLHAGLFAVALHPWTVTGQRASDGSALAWFVAVVAWIRGTWLGRKDPSLDEAIGSVAIATLAYLALFLLGAAEHRAPALHHELGTAAIVLVLSFPAAMATVSLIHERDLEVATLQRDRGSRPSLAWLGAVMVPMTGVVVLALGLALAVGPLGPLVRRVVVNVARDVARALIDIGHLFSHLFRKPKHLIATHRVAHGSGLSLVERPGKLPVWLVVVAGVLAGLVAALLVALVVRALLRLRVRLHRNEVDDEPDPDEDRESTFSWGHVLEQLWTWLRTLFGAVWRARHDARRSLPARGGGEAEVVELNGSSPTEQVRYSYRRVLRAASDATLRREPFETPAELAARIERATRIERAAELKRLDPRDSTALEDQPAGLDPAALGELTRLYEQARYGAVPASDSSARRAALHAAAVVGALQALAAEQEARGDS